MRDLTKLPTELPQPIDDGAAAHLAGMHLPAIALESTVGRRVTLEEAARAPAVIFFYPRTGRPEQPAPEGWDAIPGARGCTPQSCGFRDLSAEFATLGCAIFGVSTQTPEYQLEFAKRTNLPFELLSDANLTLTRRCASTMEFPIASGGPTTLIRRMAWFCEESRIIRVWYPVFPPDRNAKEVLRWLVSRVC